MLPDVDTSRPSAARIYDFMLGGCHNFPVDRAAAAAVIDVVPESGEIAWANRGFHQRAARWIAGQGISQFRDVGCGLFTVGNTHEVVREVRPDTTVVYVDLDPAVAQQATVLRGDPDALFIQADLRDPAPLLTDPRLAALMPPYRGAPAEVAHLGLWGCEDPRLAESDSSRWGYCGVARVR